MAVALLGSSTEAANANDSVAEMAAGGLVLKASAEIDLLSEDLFVSAKQIRVHYVFLNRSDHPVTRTIAFPMPVQDLRESVERDLAYPQGFSTSVNGRRIDIQVERRATLQNADVSLLLHRLHVPLYDSTAGDVTAAIGRLSQRDRNQLVESGLVAGAGQQGTYAPMWKVQEKWFWSQRFPAGKQLNVAHRYEPGVGTTAGVPLSDRKFRNSREGRVYAAEFCANRQFLAAIDRMQHQVQRRRGRLMEERIRYILTTGGNWRRPISDFRMIVDKGRPDAIISFCGSHVRKISATSFEMRLKNWRPAHDLAVLIVSFERS